MKTRGEVVVIVLAVLAALGVGAWIVKPSWFPGAAKRAANSTKATAELVAATEAQGASAAASIVKIAEANGMAPESPSRSFIAQESPLTLSLLPKPDPKALLEAERRRSAVMEGRLEEAQKLYQTQAKEAARLQRERDEALAARRAADLALEQAAAAEHAKNVQMFVLGAIAFFFLAGWIYTKVFSVGHNTLGKIKADILAGANPHIAIDTFLGPRMFKRVERATVAAVVANTKIPDPTIPAKPQPNPPTP